ncbi:polysaccharide pyruvyl transferase CsaB [Vampirovibrio sp.]|uniref:polysaccharide pyruvyl transferase CsaB n=1 Tax=Vampirovibrio sp. TaxID=2717857 RepID=UPI003593B94A
MKKNSKAPPNKKNSQTPPQKQKASKKFKKSGDLHPSVLISGYYGFDNLGDELILKVLVDELKARQVNITVLSQNPKKTAETYGVKAIKRTSFIDVVDALTRTNLFISGGGGLFQDVTGPMSALYYGGLIHLARFFDVPVVFWAQGVGPLKGKLSQSMTASALKKCEKITVRDEKSAALVESLMGQKPDITADPVWLLKVNKPKALKSGAKQKPGRKLAPFTESAAPTPWRVGLSLRPWHELSADKLEALADCLNAMAEQRDGPVQFILLPFQKTEDTELLENFAKRLNVSRRITVEMVAPMAVLEAVGTCDILLGMRFHSLILGLLYGVPVYGLTYDPKVASLLAMFHLKGTSIATLKTISPDALNAAFAHYPDIDLKPFREQSRKNLKVLEQLLEIPESKLVL